MSQEIVQIQQMGDALRNTGYKNISSAIAEIVDNSVEAGYIKGHSDIFILLTEKVDVNSGRKAVKEIAILDNGCGMDDLKLGACLGIGFTTRAERKGMGRFGVGLPQASLHACPRVSVYSWQNGYENCKKVWLDIEKVKTGEQTNINDPELEKLHYKYEEFLNYEIDGQSFNFTNEGTLVLWQDCDRVTPKSMPFLMRDLEFALGQKFRHLIHDGKMNLYLINTDNIDDYRKVYPNDPLFLMNDNLILGDRSQPGEVVEKNMDRSNAEPIFEPYGNETFPDGVIEYPVKYYKKDGSVGEELIKISFSKVKPEFYTEDNMPKDPGNTPIGKHAKSLVGISIVRADREIDFAKFDFFDDVNEPQHRWWGCEIRFNPVLDEAFGVANNKQYVELKKVDPLDFDDEIVKPIWLQIYNIVSKTISEMYAKNKKARESTRSVKKPSKPSEVIVNQVEEGNATDSKSKIIKESKSEQELLGEIKDVLSEEVEDISEEDLNELAKNYLNNRVNFIYKRWGRSGSFFDRSSELGTTTVTVNVDHDFYKNFFEKACSDPDTKTTFELFLAAFAVATDELDVSQQDQNDNVLSEWNLKLRNYILKQFGKL